ncbi:hypothetical protein VOLCADRAFT_89364 [Volvox carteri f. nagariensis]|uniref:Uncharacterized protein n=1 Tax=Volvox carteri f. nagariensis TaxID=3068 RepID=D8TRI3_VOLCA|nr:uncharacterized protein VOLCADRAFT_89364 [Volvox carteri f. nagariensis]EFJ49998.1 hypothetical protein VOLCADRAFT_89364 [Volvox carteri f. nagariensis]|eukprot:XP_002949063.1 hypothetical protein VOLCADRAFT_89364 [Volvox carteri f. nagariensis]
MSVHRLCCIVQRILLTSGNEGCQDARFIARCLASLGYLVSMRSALAGTGADCFKSLRHEFLVVRGPGGMEFIVEPSLRPHFSITYPSPEYDYVLSRTPDVFVGGSCRLVPVVQLLCALMADSFQRQGLHLPPWRTKTAMMSKWMPQPHRTRDTPVLPPPSTAGATASAPSPFPSSGDMTVRQTNAIAEMEAAALSRGYILPAPPHHCAAHAGVFDLAAIARQVFRTDSSDESTGSSGGFVGHIPLGHSPVSVLRLLAATGDIRDGASAAGGHGGRGGSRALPAAPAAAGGPMEVLAVQRGFEPVAQAMANTATHAEPAAAAAAAEVTAFAPSECRTAESAVAADMAELAVTTSVPPVGFATLSQLEGGQGISQDMNSMVVSDCVVVGGGGGGSGTCSTVSGGEGAPPPPPAPASKGIIAAVGRRCGDAVAAAAAERWVSRES